MTAAVLPVLTGAPSVPKDTDVLVVGLATASDGAILIGVPDDVERAVRGVWGRDLREVAQSLGAKADVGTTVVVALPDLRVVVVGVGDVDVTPETVRRAAGSGVRAAAALGTEHPVAVTVSLDAVQPEVLEGAAEGALLGAYLPPRVTGQPAVAPLRALAIVTPGKDPRPSLDRARTIAEAVCRARSWVNLPANELYPESFAEQARVVAREARLEVDVLDAKGLERGGFGGILAVGGGSSRPPRLVRIAYAPRGARVHLALVGKGITFDSGGLNLKPAEGMYTMKCDMAGAAAVLASVRAIADLGLKVRVTAYAAMAENLPSGTAYRPSDVLTMYGGKTVENANSDAEGRLVMADALARAVEDEPDLVVDVATLTGACMIALGERVGGLMASDDETADRLLDAAEAAGEAFWQLPIPEHVKDNLVSDIADLKSSGTTRYGGALTAAAFLRSFVGDTPWAHLDIAGPAWNDKVAYDYVPKGGTGSGVRTLVSLARVLAS